MRAALLLHGTGLDYPRRCAAYSVYGAGYSVYGIHIDVRATTGESFTWDPTMLPRATPAFNRHLIMLPLLINVPFG